MSISNIQSSVASPHLGHESPIYQLRSCLIPLITPDSNSISSDQESFINLSFDCFLEVVDLIKNRPSVRFEDLLVLIGKHRQTIAIIHQDFDWMRFGVLRSANIADKVSTDLIGKYSHLISPLMELKKNDPTVQWEYYSETEFNPIRLGHRIGISSKNEKIPLTRYILFSNKSSLAHSYPEHLPKIMDECSFLLQKIIHLETTHHPREIHRLIAKLHWWMAHGCFYFRGSAFSGEIMVASLLYLKFGELSPYQANIIPDQLALVMDEEQFIQIYPFLRISK